MMQYCVRVVIFGLLLALANVSSAVVFAEVAPNTLQQADLAITLARVDLDGINLTLNAAQQAVELTQNNIDSLENQAKDTTIFFRASNQQQKQLQLQLKNQKNLLGLQQDRVKVLQQTQSLATRALVAAQDNKNQLQTKYQLQQQVNRQQALDKLAASLQIEQQQWLSRISELNHQLQQARGNTNSNNYATLEIGIFEAQERSNLNQIQLDLARLHARFADLSVTPEQVLSLNTLSTAQHQLDTLYQQLTNTVSMLDDKLVLLQKRIKIVNQGLQAGTLAPKDAQANLLSLSHLHDSYQAQLDAASSLEDQVHDYQQILVQQLNKQLASRQSLPADSQQWFILGQKLVQIPALAGQTVHGLQKAFLTTINSANIFELILWSLVLAVWGIACTKLRISLGYAIERIGKQHKDILTTNSFIVSLKLLHKHLMGIVVLSGFVVALLMMGLSLQLFSLIIELGLVLLVFRSLISLARYSLLESLIHKQGKDVLLYQRLKWVLRVGGVITALTVLVHKLPLPYDIQDLFGRLFMLVLLVVALVLLRGWEVVPTLLEPYLQYKHHYLRQAVRWLSLLIPLSLLLNSIIGLFGYVELAWSIAAYQGIFLLVVTGYLLARGFLGEIMKFFSEQVIRLSRNGWLWSEALLKPLHQVLKLFLFLESIIVLFKLYGWGTHSYVVTEIGNILSSHLFIIAGSVITPWNIIVLLTIVVVLIWAARWSREFAYRWLFANTKDLGLRNSLAIFTQYITVALGILIGLKMAGINVTVLTVIASAFALGIGLGLRDIANNFVCGILLLMERPVRVGDYVTIGNLDGQVVHVGARSVTVTTDDHKELLVPNSDVFSKVFMNWTHRDNIVRTLFTIRINRQDDPHQVSKMISQVIGTIPEVLSNPPVQVYLRKLEDVLLEFEIEYFLDMRKNAARWTVHSKVLFALWDRFKLEGIQAPEHAHEIVVHAKERGQAIKSQFDVVPDSYT